MIYEKYVIGNLLTEINYGIISVNLTDIENIYRGDVNYNRIPLTEDILLKCGWSLEDFEVGRILCGKDYFIISRLASTKLYYLDQLQNIYFFLTNEELNVKL